MAIGPTNPTTAPDRRPPTSGLIAYAPAAPLPEGGWDGEPLGWDGEACGPAVTLPQDCGQTPVKDLPTLSAPVLADPVVIMSGDPCISVMGRSFPADRNAAIARARAHLAATQSAALEFTAWTGEATSDDTAEGADRVHFASADTVVLGGGAGLTVPHGLGLIDQALTVCLSNGQGMVHVTPYTLVQLQAAGLLERENGRWITPNGHLVVAGAGYTGGGPRAVAEDPLPAAPDLLATPPVNQWIYGTAMVHVAIGAIRDDLEVVRVDVNSATTIVERPAAALWSCCQYAAQLDLTPA